MVGLLLIVQCFIGQVALADNAPTLTDTKNAPPKPIPQYTIKIASPAPEQTFQNEAQSINVSVNVTPALEQEDLIALYVDGTASGDPGSSATITTPWLERGSHTLQAKIIQPKGKGAESEVITIYQQRTSKLLPPQ